MKANEVRKKFLEYFKSKGHTLVASDSVVPKDDPTVLFTTAGMQQFKRQFLGHIDEYTRAATSQKCLRTDDLDKVGQTAFHHTFFEMLGNFSFGDYFKREAIAWGWEFLTHEMKLPAEKLWVSVYKDDDEAYTIWLKEIKIPADRIVKLGDKSNFWPSDAKEKGPNGPCGPCSEIFYDYGVNANCPKGKDCDPDCNCGRFSEVWNLVFTQFNRKEGGVLEPLPAKNIDTGMGLERLVAVVQGKKSNYETDLFTPILQAIDKDIDKGQLKLEPKEKFIMADHARAVVFAINDGVIPSNKERGSVVKRLINDSTNIPLSRGAKEPTMYKLVSVVAEVMKAQYPDVGHNAIPIADLVRKAEEAFIAVRQQRIPEFKSTVAAAKTPEERGNLYFLYRDTYGLPLSVIVSTAQSVGISRQQIEEDTKFYERHMQQQKDRSRAGSKMAGDVFTDAELDLNVPKTDFVGYKEARSQSKVLRLFKNNQAVEKVAAGDDVNIVLDKTPFYAESGGQVGDSGFLHTDKCQIRIHDTQKISDVYIHSGTVESGSIHVVETVEAEIDVDRRIAIMRNHTATHLLQAALRKVLGAHVQQQGSLVAEDRLRFDFTHPQAITKTQIAEIENFVNSRVLACNPVSKEVMALDEAKKSGALAFFAEKYGSTVRVVSIGGYSKEFCGGTHLDSTGEIGLFKITGESAIAQGIRRIEAKTGLGAMALVNEQAQQLEKIAQAIKAPVSEVVDRVEGQTKKLKQLEKDLGQYRFEAIKETLDNVINQAESIGEKKIITHLFTNVEIETLRKISDLLKQKIKSTVIVLGASLDGSASLMAAVSDDLVAKGIKANEIISAIAPIIQGSGGGRPQLAQAGSKETVNLPKALEQAKQLVKQQLAK